MWFVVIKSIGRSSYWLSFELVSYLLCVSAYPVTLHIRLAVEIQLCNTEWLFFWHSATMQDLLFLTTLQEVKCQHRVPNSTSMKGCTTTWCVQHDTKNVGVLHLKIIMVCLWKRHRDLHLLAERPWRSYACSWLILLDIRHCLFKLHNILIPPCTDCFLMLSVWICGCAASRMHIVQWSQVILWLLIPSSGWAGHSYSNCAKNKSMMLTSAHTLSACLMLWVSSLR